mmetsp:Transcript_33813/g.74000  ORF Transcript_33813/g.74000 Transcript_33813/m.74000 type:complete len:214 (+) Transcript_33813:54-695(+)
MVRARRNSRGTAAEIKETLQEQGVPASYAQAAASQCSTVEEAAVWLEGGCSDAPAKQRTRATGGPVNFDEAEMKRAIALFELGYSESRVSAAVQRCGTVESAVAWLEGREDSSVASAPTSEAVVVDLALPEGTIILESRDNKAWWKRAANRFGRLTAALKEETDAKFPPLGHSEEDKAAEVDGKANPDAYSEADDSGDAAPRKRMRLGAKTTG